MDNKSTNKLCRGLRRLAHKYDTAVHLSHHANKGGQQYRGATDLEGSCRAVWNVKRTPGGVLVSVDKANRGRLPDDFTLVPTWIDGAVTFEVSTDATDALTENQEKVYQWFRQNVRGSQAECRAAVAVSRDTVRTICGFLANKGMLQPTGDTQNNSPIFELIDTTTEGGE